MVVWKRTIGQNLVTHAMGIFFLNLLTLLTGTFLLCIVENAQFIKIAFEAASALGNSRFKLRYYSGFDVFGKNRYYNDDVYWTYWYFYASYIDFTTQIRQYSVK